MREQPKRRQRNEEHAEVEEVGTIRVDASCQTNSQPLVPAGYSGLLDACVHLRNCAAMSTLWDILPETSKQLVFAELRKLGLRRTDVMV